MVLLGCVLKSQQDSFVLNSELKKEIQFKDFYLFTT